MNIKDLLLESTISKDIYDAISPPIQSTILHMPSTPNFISKNYSLSLIEEEKSEQKEEESNREYKIGNYMVKYTLGQGTFGKVKLGIYIPNEEKVAIKILEKNRIIEKDDEIRVKREFDMLAQFSHPNVILVAEIFESEDSFYSVMEFCEGGELFNYIVKKSRLCEDESAFFFFQLINGLEYIHSLGIVHRDLKPENLLLTSDHILKIIDFGLSNYFKTGQKELLSTPCGSPCYASPEMVAGKKYDGFKIDVWSCGIILYAMLCGYLPFEDQDNEILFKKILECKLEYPNYVNKLSIDLIEKILVTDPDKRITIPDIKKHPFYLKGKSIFEQNFSINNLIQNPIEKVNSKKNIEINKDNKDNNNNSNKDIINDRIIQVDINNDKEKEKEKADIGIKNDKDIKDNNNNNNNDNKKEKEKINKNNKRIKNKKKDNKDNKENIDDNKNKNKLNIEINLDNKGNNNKIIDEKMKTPINNKNDKKIIVIENEENNYQPLKTEYNNNNSRLNNHLDNIKKNKENKKTEKSVENDKNNVNKKYSDISKENTLKKYFELNQREKSNKKEKQKTKTKQKDMNNNNNEIFKVRKQEIMNITKKMLNVKQKKEEEDKKKETLTPKKIYHISKNVKSQRPSNIPNLTNKMNLNIKINPKKYLKQKINKIMTTKETKKMKSTLNNNNNNHLNLNINKFSNISQIKSILNSFNTKKKEKENNNNNYNHLKTETNKLSTNIIIKNVDDNNNNNIRNNIQRLRTESQQNKNKNFIDKKYIFNNTIDIINNIDSKRREINSYINTLKEKSNLNDIKRIKSSNFKDNNLSTQNNYSTKTYSTLFGKKIQSLRNKPSELIYGINNFANHKYETDILDNNNNNINKNILKTEPSSELYSKINNNISNNRYNNHFNYINKNNNSNISSINSRRTNLHYPSSYFRYFNMIKKAPTYNLLKTVNLKGIPMTTSNILKKKKKLNQNSVKDKKNQQVTIRNTVINFNMIDTGIILPSFKKIKNEKKLNNNNLNNNNNNISGRLRPNKKFSKEINSNLSDYNNTINSLNTINDNNKYNNTLNKFNNNIKPFGTSTINQENKTNSSLTSFNKLINKIKNKQKYNKIQFNNMNEKNKIHNKYKSMKLNEYIRSNINEKKNRDIFSINNNNSNISNNSINKAININNNRLKTINNNNDKNLTIPSFLNKNKKFVIPKGRGYLLHSQGKVIKFYNSFKVDNPSNNINDNYKQLSIKGISNL